MAKKKISLPITVIEPVILVKQKKWFIKIGNNYYKRLQPVPWNYLTPDYSQLKN